MTKLPPALLLTALLGLAQCKNADPAPQPPATPLSQLPPETQTGQRTFGCLVNGQPWTPAGNPFAGPLLSAEYFNQQLTISTGRAITVGGVRTDQGIEINVKKVQFAGVITLADSVNDFANVVDLVTHCHYYTNPNHQGVLEITRLDPIARIVSGRFSFTLETPGCGRVVVTDGRFDCPF